jgi:ribosomal RNA-processing protein 12
MDREVDAALLCVIRYKPKGKGTGGDMKGASKLEPFAYWKLDRKMLNRRSDKSASASKGLSKLIAGANSGALRGAKAKRASKRQRV